MHSKLQVGQIFTTPALSKARYKWGNGDVDRSKLLLDYGLKDFYDHRRRILCADGVIRYTLDSISLIPEDIDNLKNVEFEVIHTEIINKKVIPEIPEFYKLPEDTFPEGYLVKAKEVNGNRTVEFCQSQCYHHSIMPSEIMLRRGPDEPQKPPVKEKNPDNWVACDSDWYKKYE